MTESTLFEDAISTSNFESRSTAAASENLLQEARTLSQTPTEQLRPGSSDSNLPSFLDSTLPNLELFSKDNETANAKRLDVGDTRQPKANEAQALGALGKTFLENGDLSKFASFVKQANPVDRAAMINSLNEAVPGDHISFEERDGSLRISRSLDPGNKGAGVENIGINLKDGSISALRRETTFGPAKQLSGAEAAERLKNSMITSDFAAQVDKSGSKADGTKLGDMLDAAFKKGGMAAVEKAAEIMKENFKAFGMDFSFQKKDAENATMSLMRNVGKPVALTIDFIAEK